jgi:acetylornithine/succinyldiaminopimelate/putrescine aminotransferase
MNITNQKLNPNLEWYDGFPGTAWFVGEEGRTYLDLRNGQFVLGRRHPRVVQPVRKQMEERLRSPHTNRSDTLTEQATRLLADLTLDMLPYFCAGGHSALKMCLDAAKEHTGRQKIIVCVEAIDSVDSVEASHAFETVESFEQIRLCVTNNSDQLRELFAVLEFTGEIPAAVLIEPVTVDMHLVDTRFLQTAREMCNKYGALLIFNEVGCGLGRTGRWWGYSHSGVEPDAMALGEGLGGGVMPVGACVVSKTVRFSPHCLYPWSTAMVAVISTLTVIQYDQLIQSASKKGEYLCQILTGLLQEFREIVREIGGCGLMWSVSFVNAKTARKFVKGLQKYRLLIRSGGSIVWLEPPLTITVDDLDIVAKSCRNVLKEIAHKPKAML